MPRVEQGAALPERSLRLHDGRERCVIDYHRSSPVGRGGRRFGDDDGDRLAHVADAALGQDYVALAVDDVECLVGQRAVDHSDLGVDVLARHHGNDAGNARCRGGVEARDLGVSV